MCSLCQLAPQLSQATLSKTSQSTKQLGRFNLSLFTYLRSGCFVAREVSKCHDFEFDARRRECRQVLDHIFTFGKHRHKCCLDIVFKQRFGARLVLFGLAGLIERREEGFFEEVTSMAFTAFQSCGLLKVKEEERHLGYLFLCCLRLISLLDLFQVEQGLKLGKRLLRQLQGALL